MPPLELRGRYLMREYWSDAELFTRLTADQRELYVGLWMLADDEGWLPGNRIEIGAALYRFLEKDAKSVLVREGIARLARINKLKSYRCGCIWLPAVSKYPRAGKKSTLHRQNHAKHSKGFEVSGPKPQKDSNGFEHSIQTDLNPSPVPVNSSPVAGARAQGSGARRGMPFAFEDVVKEVKKP